MHTHTTAPKRAYCLATPFSSPTHPHAHILAAPTHTHASHSPLFSPGLGFGVYDLGIGVSTPQLHSHPSIMSDDESKLYGMGASGHDTG